MAQFISLRTQGRCGEIMVNVDEISSCHIEGGFSYTDYILILKNGTMRYKYSKKGTLTLRRVVIAPIRH